MTKQLQQSDDAKRERSRHRARLVKDLMIFQVKLLLEGLKDVVLGPLSLAAAVLDFIAAKQAPDRYLDATMQLGRRYEEWLDLYGVPEQPKLAAELAGATTQPAVIVADEARDQP